MVYADIDRRRFAAFAGAFVCAGLGGVGSATAADKVYTSLVPGVGAGGYDVVEYFRAGRATAGAPGITATAEGVTYRFASTANRDAFVAAPGRYLPQFGGYCAWAVANGYTAKGDPEAWSVVGGKLYLNYSKSVRSEWERDVPGNITKGEANWPRVLE